MHAHVAAACAALLLASCGTVSVYDENDLWVPGGGDEYYTHGTRVSSIFTASRPTPAEDAAEARDAATADAPRDADSALLRAVRALPFYDSGRTTQIGVVVGQEMYTPADISLRRLQRDDRPYAGWAYVGLLVANAQRRAEESPAGDHVHTFEIDLGIVGPHSYAQDAQEFVHRASGSQEPRGWRHQLRDEPGVVATYDMRRRLLALGGVHGPGFDVLGNAGASLGNVLTQAAAGLTVRVGWDLPRDFGVNTLRTTAVEVPDVLRGGVVHGYVFGGADGRAIARNVFIDGNTFRDSHSVDREPFVTELKAGLAVELGDLRLAMTVVNRSREFDGQPGAQRFGSISLTYTIEF